jgi:hypothetical protein
LNRQATKWWPFFHVHIRISWRLTGRLWTVPRKNGNFLALVLGWTQEKISDQVGLNQNWMCQIINNAIYGNIDNLLKQGRT